MASPILPSNRSLLNANLIIISHACSTDEHFPRSTEACLAYGFPTTTKEMHASREAVSLAFFRTVGAQQISGERRVEVSGNPHLPSSGTGTALRMRFLKRH